MTIVEQTIHRIIALLYSSIDEPPVPVPVPQNSPVRRFAAEYLVADPDADLTSEEAWKFYYEIVQAFELPPMRKAVFLRQLPVLMEAQFHVRKCHHIEREGGRQRGFRGVGIRMDRGSYAVLEGQPE